MMRAINAIVSLVFFSIAAIGQTETNKVQDTLRKNSNLEDVTVVGKGSKMDYQQMPEIVGTNIYAGKKNALIVLDNVQGNVVTNTMRQVLAKVAGIHIWESDPSGIQIGIAARGLSPNRSWEFNIRQNGYDIAADPFGYPEAYYNPQLQAVQRIEVVRGQGSLQYGPQFGGMVNYILRNGSDIEKPFQFETQQTLGSNNMINTYNAVGGKTAKIHYYSFFDHRGGNGWRANSNYYTNAGFGTLTYFFNQKVSLTVEVMRSNIRSQQPGGLIDSIANADPKKSCRSRNWFDITWTNPSLILNYQISPNTRWNTKLFATIGDRNSIGFTPSLGILQSDTINPSTLNYSNRVRNVDQYRNYALESRFITDYRLGEFNNTISAGIRLYTGTTNRFADADVKNGSGSAGTDYDMVGIKDYTRNIEFKSQNIAAFAENIFRLGKKLLIIPGIRYEWLKGSAAGINGNDATGLPIILQNISRSRSFVLAGVGAEFHLTKETEVYANYSQAYRPIQFANLQAPPSTNLIDPDLKDAQGYNIDFGYRGKVGNYLQFDVSGFYLQYNNRVGNVSFIDSSGSVPVSRILVTNVGASTSKGFEGYAELNIARTFSMNNKSELSIFGSYSYLDAHYSSTHKDKNIQGRKVENAPDNIFRGGISAGCHDVLLTLQYSYVGSTFSDANNTEAVAANGQTGLIPSYAISDLTVSYRFSKQINVKTGINNLMDQRYFTRRAGGYPGPGALPGDGRTFFVSIGVKL